MDQLFGNTPAHPSKVLISWLCWQQPVFIYQTTGFCLPLLSPPPDKFSKTSTFAGVPTISMPST